MVKGDDLQHNDHLLEPCVCGTNHVGIGTVIVVSWHILNENNKQDVYSTATSRPVQQTPTKWMRFSIIFLIKDPLIICHVGLAPFLLKIPTNHYNTPKIFLHQYMYTYVPNTSQPLIRSLQCSDSLVRWTSFTPQPHSRFDDAPSGLATRAGFKIPKPTKWGLTNDHTRAARLRICFERKEEVGTR